MPPATSTAPAIVRAHKGHNPFFQETWCQVLQSNIYLV
jgi:hypothetical protein